MLTVPSDGNIALKEMERKGKYKDIELEIQTMWHMKTVVIPVVVGALVTVKKGMVENIKKLSERATVTEIQRSACWGLHESSGRCSMYDDAQKENQQRL